MRGGAGHTAATSPKGAGRMRPGQDTTAVIPAPRIAEPRRVLAGRHEGAGRRWIGQPSSRGEKKRSERESSEG
jgi:hypothetical protein